MDRIRKLLPILVLCFCLSALYGVDILVEHHGAATDFITLIPVKSIIFERNQSRIEYQLSIEIRSNNKVVLRHEETLKLQNVADLGSAAFFVTFDHLLPAGNYSLDLILRNRTLGDRRTLKRTFSIGISSIEIGHAYLVGEIEGTRYLLSSQEQIKKGFDELYLYQNISMVVDSIHVSMRDQRRSYSDLKPTNKLVLDWIKDSPNPGKIDLLYYEDNIRYKSEPFLYGTQFGIGSQYSLKDQIEQLRYITTQNEWNTIRRIPSSNYAEAIEQFWLKHDPSPGTQRNENREEFYRRIQYADEKFGIHTKLKGWKSDRGRIYVKFGIPDDIQTNYHPNDSYPYIVWQYYHLNKRFVFVDSRGYGDYRLENKEEEYYDY